MDVDAGLAAGWFVRFVERVVAFHDGRRASGRERPVRGRLSALPTKLSVVPVAVCASGPVRVSLSHVVVMVWVS